MFQAKICFRFQVSIKIKKDKFIEERSKISKGGTKCVFVLKTTKVEERDFARTCQNTNSSWHFSFKTKKKQ